MDRLKSVLADKIIEIAAENSEKSKTQLEKLNRFRDFSFACEALIKKYPRIEDELVRMIETNDFDTRIASSRVNNIISFSEDEQSLHAQSTKDKAPIVEDEFVESEKTAVEEAEEPYFEYHSHKNDISSETFDAIEQPDFDYSEQIDELPVCVAPSTTENIGNLEEDVDDSKNLTIPEIPNNYERIEDAQIIEEVLDTEEESVSRELPIAESDKEKNVLSAAESQSTDYVNSDDVNFEYAEKSATVTNIKRILIVLAVVAALILVYLLIRFVMNNWQTILIVLGGLVVLGGIVWFFASRKNNDNNE